MYGALDGGGGSSFERQPALASSAWAGDRDEPNVGAGQQGLRFGEVAASADEAMVECGQRRTSQRRQRREALLETRCDELEKSLRGGHVLEPVIAEPPERDGRVPVASGEVARGLRDDDLAPVSGRAHSGGHVHVDADVPLIHQPGLARVDCDRHPDLRRLRPLLGVERPLQVGRCHHGITSTLEDQKHAVPCPIDLTAPALGGRGPDELADPGVDVRIALAEGVQEPRRALDVGEQQGHGSGREASAHGAGVRRAAAGAAARATTRLAVVLAGHLEIECRVLRQDRLFELAERAVGLDSELVHQRPSCRLIGSERLCLSPRAIEGEHQLRSEALSEGVLGDERLELAGELGVTSRGEVEVDPLFETGEAQLLEAGDPVMGEACGGELGKRRAAPQRERCSGISVPHESLEALEIELVLLHLDAIAGRFGLHAVPAERLAQVRDVDLHRLLCRLRPLILPERVDQALGGDDLVRVQEEHRQQRAVLGACQGHHSLPVDHVEWTEDPELHRSATVPPCPEPLEPRPGEHLTRALPGLSRPAVE